MATKLDISDETLEHFPTVCGKTVFQQCLRQRVSEQSERPLQPTKPSTVRDFASAFVVTKLDIFHETPGHFPAVFVATKLNICNGTLEHLPGGFVETKPYILKYEICFNQVVSAALSQNVK